MDPSFPDRRRAVDQTLSAPNTFTREALSRAIADAMGTVNRTAIEQWIGGRSAKSRDGVAVLNAGNVPFVGLFDLVGVLATGRRYVGVLSGKSPYLLPGFVETLHELWPDCPARFESLSAALSEAGWLVATGADATLTQVAMKAKDAGILEEHQFLRGTRFSVGVLDGSESAEELDSMAEDMVVHEGRGCLNASVVFVPESFDRSHLLEACRRVRLRFPAHPSTRGSIAREERLFRATGRIFDRAPGVLLVEGRPAPRGPGVVVLSRVDSTAEAATWISSHADALQAVIGSPDVIDRLGVPEPLHTCSTGESQRPPLGWSQDGRDLIRFLTS
jgi:hypothetical protein